MSDLTNGSGRSPGAPTGHAARRACATAAPFVFGFLAGLGLCVGLLAPQLPPTSKQSPTHWNDPATFVPRFAPDTFRDERRLIDVTWPGRGQRGPAGFVLWQQASAAMAAIHRQRRTE